MTANKQVELKDFQLSEDGEVKAAFLRTGEVDHDGDYNFPGCIPTKDLPISAYQHASWPHRGGALPAGRGQVKEAGGWGVLSGQFFIDTTIGRDTYLTVKHMAELQEWSFGFDVIEKAAPPADAKSAKRGVKLYDPHEVSPVLLGAGVGTHTLAVKGHKAAADNVSRASSCLAMVLSLIQDEAGDLDPSDPDEAEDVADVALLGDIRDLLSEYIASTAAEVGTPDDMGDIAEEAAARAMSMSPTMDIGMMSRSIEAAMKGALPAGITFAEASSRLLRQTKAMTERTRSIGAIRAKEGRPQVSTARLARLRAQRDAIREAYEAMEAFVAEVDQPKEEAGKSLSLAAARARLRAAQLSSTTAGVTQ